MEKVIATIVLIPRKNPSTGTLELLLGWKTRKFCKFHWVPYGGKQEPGQSLDDCARDETYQEIGVRIEKLNYCGIIRFYNGETTLVECHIYVAEKWSGEPQEKDEAIINHTWYPIDALPAAPQMPRADYEWIPKIFSLSKDDFLQGEVWYRPGTFDEYLKPPVWKIIPKKKN